MMSFIAARIDRHEIILVNARLDGYPANFRLEPAAVDAFFASSTGNADAALALVEAQWPRIAPALEKLVRRYGNDFLATVALVTP
ncbi:hypothetical protein [Crenobacter luteus]|uniref:Uncharacterized protein n=1 Tax=Crenobacter luteus TaxID=1452487 RepID=A0A165G5I8_9NEIS|nr:hypothetical protein [Crenobacter luteus]KZE35169.1 hypothetical protein AVW16_05205 [Crenobacter luteus]